MATYKMEKETTAAANQMVVDLKNEGIDARFDTSTVRDYMAKVAITPKDTNHGHVCIYSNSEGKLRLETGQLRNNNEDLMRSIKKAWRNTTQHLLEQRDTPQTPTTPQVATHKPFVPLDQAKLPLTAFPDGSFKDDRTGWGVLIADANGNRVHEAWGAVRNNTNRQIAGELAAAIYTLHWAEQHQLPTLTISPDYQGIISWAIPDPNTKIKWKASDPMAQQYVEAFNRTPTKISFAKVAGHSNNQNNERADELADNGRHLAPGTHKSTSAPTKELPVPTTPSSQSTQTTTTPASPPPTVPNNPLANLINEVRQGNCSNAISQLMATPNNTSVAILLATAHDYGQPDAVQALTTLVYQEHNTTNKEWLLQYAASHGTPQTLMATANMVQADSDEIIAAINQARSKPHNTSRGQRIGADHYDTLVDHVTKLTKGFTDHPVSDLVR